MGLKPLVMLLDSSCLLATYDAAHGARAMLEIQSYGQDGYNYDGNAYTFASTYHSGTGTLQMYAMHPTEPASPGLVRPKISSQCLPARRSARILDHNKKIRSPGTRSGRQTCSVGHSGWTESNTTHHGPREHRFLWNTARNLENETLEGYI
ncbi:hypothetical protein K469DRAFT_687802 [Zopfia rhizophila CBS 207.26]|uniref:Uncharacterized protein n=1 Tax=Zopfia rhizophila CBS 207.26 TaxID=1314779 RepID=A0A6A6E4J9_9PEZI|nr:hypothetical protein K469DRAFT_687802 [Zopfia rhizophila CBS 207.26]